MTVSFVTSDPRASGLVGEVGDFVYYVTGGVATPLVKYSSGDKDWSITTTGAVPVTSDPRTGAGLAANTGDEVIYLSSGVVTPLVKYGAGDKDWATYSAEGIASTLDRVGSTRGAVLYRGASGWSALSPGSATKVLTSNGAGADPSWEAAAGGGVSDGDKGDVTVSSSGATWTIDNGAVTNAKRANMSEATISGRAAGAGTGAPTDLSAAQVKTLLAVAASDVSGLATVATSGSASDLSTGTLAAARMPAFTGDVTTSAGAVATTIANDAVSYAKIQNVSATDKVLGRSSAGSGDVEEIACTSAGRALIAEASVPAQRIALRTARTERTEWFTTNAATGIGTIGSNTPTGTGTTALVSIATTSAYTMQRRTAYSSSALAGNSCGVRMGASLCFGLGDAAYKGGFTMVFRFGVADAVAVANARMFVGLTSSTSAIGNVEPSSLTNVIGVGCDAGGSNLAMIHNDGSGTATTVDLGASFPANTLSTDFYELVLYAAPNASSVTYRVVRVTSGDVATGTLSTNLPSGTTLLGPQFWRNNGSTSYAVRLEVGGWIAEVGE